MSDAFDKASYQKRYMEEYRKNRKRVEVHICSISIEELKRISMEKFLQRENA